MIVLFPFFRYSFYLYAGDFYKHALSAFIPITLLFFALQALYHVNKTGRVNTLLLGATLVVLLGLLFFPYPGVKELVNGPLSIFIAVMLVIYTMLLYCWRFTRYRLVWQIALLALIAVEVGWMGNITLNDREPYTGEEFRQRIGYNDYSKEALAYLKSQDPSFHRVTKLYSSSPSPSYGLNDALIQNYYGSTAYKSQNNNHYVRFLKEVGAIDVINKINSKWLFGLRNNVLLQGIGSSKYLLQKKGNETGIDGFLDPMGDLNDVQLFRNKCYIPFGFCYDQYLPFEEFQQLEAGNQRSWLMYQAAVVEGETLPKVSKLPVYNRNNLPVMSQEEIRYAAAVRAGKTLNIGFHSQNKIEGSIALAKPQLMFLSIPYHKGWSAEVNGQPADLLKVNIGFMGLMLEPGQHHIQLSYTPVYFYEGWIVFFLGLAIYLFLVWRTYVHRKRAQI